MTRNILSAISILSCVMLFSCQMNKTEKTTAAGLTLTADEKKTAEKEIAAQIDVIIKGASMRNSDTALLPYSNDSSFRIVTPEATVTNYAMMKEEQTLFMQQATKVTFTTVKEDFIFLANDLVMCTWSGKNETEFKNGEGIKADPYTGSMLFKKQNNEWKIIYAHESAAQPEELKPKK